MNKKDKKRILKAMNRVSSNFDLYSCIAIGNQKLRDRYASFYNKKSNNGAYTFGFKSIENHHNYEEIKNHRLTALALFMIAEKDIK